MAKAKIIFLLVCSILLLSLVSAVQPSSTVQQFSTGYVIKEPIDNYIKVGQDYAFEFHVFNITDGKPINSGIGCYFHLYNETGSHQLILTTSTPDHIFDYGFDVKGTNFTKNEVYYYNVQCNSSSLGGYFSGSVFINADGHELTQAKAILYFMFMVLFLLLFLGSIIAITLLPSGNSRGEEGELLSISNLKYLKGTLLIVAHVLFIGVFFLASNLSKGYLNNNLFGDVLFVIYEISFWALIISIPVYLVWLFYSIFKDAEVKRMLERGVPIGDI